MKMRLLIAGCLVFASGVAFSSGNDDSGWPNAERDPTQEECTIMGAATGLIGCGLAFEPGVALGCALVGGLIGHDACKDDREPKKKSYLCPRDLHKDDYPGKLPGCKSEPREEPLYSKPPPKTYPTDIDCSGIKDKTQLAECKRKAFCASRGLAPCPLPSCTAPQGLCLHEILYYDTKKEDLLPGQKGKLSDAFGPIKQRLSWIELTGLADARGSARANLALSKRRVEKVRAYLRDTLHLLKDNPQAIVAHPMGEIGPERNIPRNRAVLIRAYCGFGKLSAKAIEALKPKPKSPGKDEAGDGADAAPEKEGDAKEPEGADGKLDKDPENPEKDGDAAAEQATAAKNAAIRAYANDIKTELRYAENTVNFDDLKLKLIGWGGRKEKTPLAAPGRALDLIAPEEGEGRIALHWNKPIDGGKPAAYNIVCREQANGVRSRIEVYCRLSFTA